MSVKENTNLNFGFVAGLVSLVANQPLNTYVFFVSALTKKTQTSKTGGQQDVAPTNRGI